MVVSSCASPATISLTKEQLDDFYDFIFGDEIMGRRPAPRTNLCTSTRLWLRFKGTFGHVRSMTLCVVPACVHQKPEGTGLRASPQNPEAKEQRPSRNRARWGINILGPRTLSTRPPASLGVAKARATGRKTGATSMTTPSLGGARSQVHSFGPEYLADERRTWFRAFGAGRTTPVLRTSRQGPFTRKQAALVCGCNETELCVGAMAGIQESDKVRTIFDTAIIGVRDNIRQNTNKKTTAPTLHDLLRGRSLIPDDDYILFKSDVSLVSKLTEE